MLGENYFIQFDIKSSVYDNDFAYVIVNFGLLGLLIYFSYLYELFKRFKRFKLFIIMGLIVSLTLNFFLEPKSFILILLSLFYLKYKFNEKTNLDIN